MPLTLSSALLSPCSTPSRLAFASSPQNCSVITLPATNPWRSRSRSARLSTRAEATFAVESTAAGGAAAGPSGTPNVILEVKDLTAVVAESRQEILRGVNLTIRDGEVHAIMGKNGSGKSTLSKFFGFLSPKLAAVNMNPRFLDRNVNEGFSGGEKKRNEILQLAVLEADLAILDEIDSGLDVDALQDVAKAVNGLLAPNRSILMITHYQRLLDYIKPSYIHIMDDGRIVKTGDSSLAKQLEKEGYRAVSAA